MGRNKEVQEYIDLSAKYFEAATIAFGRDLYEPALANAIHALELATKAAIFIIIKGPLKTHNVGGLFAKHFRNKVGAGICKQLNKILNKYNIPRYPDELQPEKKEVKEILDFTYEFIEEVRELL